MVPRSKVTDRFDARAEGGRELNVIELTDLLNTGPTTPPVDGVKWYQLEDGTPVNRLPDSSYEFLELGQRVTLMRVARR